MHPIFLFIKHSLELLYIFSLLKKKKAKTNAKTIILPNQLLIFNGSKFWIISLGKFLYINYGIIHEKGGFRI